MVDCAEIVPFVVSMNPNSKQQLHLTSNYPNLVEHVIYGEGSQISTNQEQKRTVCLLLIGRNLGPMVVLAFCLENSYITG